MQQQQQLNPGARIVNFANQEVVQYLVKLLENQKTIIHTESVLHVNAYGALKANASLIDVVNEIKSEAIKEYKEQIAASKKKPSKV